MTAADALRAAAGALRTAAQALDEAAAASVSSDGPDRLLSIEEARGRLGLSRTALYAQIDHGALRTVKVGRRRLVPDSAIASFTNGGTH